MLVVQKEEIPECLIMEFFLAIKTHSKNLLPKKVARIKIEVTLNYVETAMKNEKNSFHKN